ncbi:MAG: coat protein [Rhizobiaceae bacterium]|nr:coat protein [Rhizobiaceae bacterium]MCC0000961.1 methyltransferase [Methylobacteriaceae bacterium]
MAQTKLSDMIVPEIFHSYVVNKTLEKSRVYQSGIITNMTDQLIDQLGGTTVNMPFFNDLTGNDEVVDESQDISVAGVSTGKEVAVKLYRARAYGGTDLAADLAGADPMNVVMDRFADWWARKMQTTLLATLKGAMSAANMSANALDISALTGGAQYFDGDSFIDATHMLGDEEGSLTAVAVHSDTLKAMKKADLIDYIKPSDGGADVPVYMGKAVIVDDGMPVTSGTYTTYVFGPGAIGYGEKAPKVPVEADRNPLVGGGWEYIVQRRQFVLHPRGLKWQGTPAKATPDNSELAVGTNWTRAVAEQKAVRMVKFVHKLAP